VTLGVSTSVLPDGAMYSARPVLDADGKELKVCVDNSGYRRLAQS
jgi:hypothetical protein